jgi:C4-dicarboxylate-specific signal transduction histidine kinase
MLTGAQEQEETARVIERIGAEALRAGEIIRRIRGFVRKAPPRRAPVELNQVAREVAELVEAEAYEHGVSLRLALQPNLPVIEADAIQIEQVVINLVRNALEAMYESPGADPTLALSTQAAELDGVELAVSDSGPARSSKPTAESCG